MKTITDITCCRCENTTSVPAAQDSELVDAVVKGHVCVDGVSSNKDFKIVDRTVLGPGEKGETTHDAC